jgi:hypothetical protein
MRERCVLLAASLQARVFAARQQGGAHDRHREEHSPTVLQARTPIAEGNGTLR